MCTSHDLFTRLYRQSVHSEYVQPVFTLKICAGSLLYTAVWQYEALVRRPTPGASSPQGHSLLLSKQIGSHLQTH